MFYFKSLQSNDDYTENDKYSALNIGILTSIRN